MESDAIKGLLIVLKNQLVRKMSLTTPTASLPVSPLRYPGSKRWMTDYLARAIVQNELRPSLFVEPFAGSATASVSLLSLGLVEKIGLVDLDPMVASFWKTVFFDTKWLINKIEKAEISLTEWNYLKSREMKTTRDLAWQCLFLNRTSFSGILANGAGPIGGQNQKSKYKVDCRFNKDNIINRIVEFSRYSDRVSFVWNCSWRLAVSRIQRMQTYLSLPRKTFFYFDPPFYHKADKLYRYWFEEHDHEKLRDYLVQLKSPWLLSYDSCEETRALFKGTGLRTNQIHLTYSTSGGASREVGKELIVSNLETTISELHIRSKKVRRKRIASAIEMAKKEPSKLNIGVHRKKVANK